MCGISGLFGNADSSITAAMASCISHRGPDEITLDLLQKIISA